MASLTSQLKTNFPMNLKTSPWICCQIGAREHYAIPIAFHQEGQLSHLITDAWVPPHYELFPFSKNSAVVDPPLRQAQGSTFAPLLKGGWGDRYIAPIVQNSINYIPRLSANLRGRYHPQLANADVSAFNYALIGFELSQRLRGISGWECTIARNNWFQKKAISVLKKLATQLSTPPIIFSYSYAALEIFRFAKQQGWTTVLGQIDPGIKEEELVIAEHQRHPDLAPEWKPAPSHYWENWREECELADHIIVNSQWSQKLLQEAGINTQKSAIVPLVYHPPEEAKNFVRTYPDAFSEKRPLRVLFLGQVILRKGMAAVLSAIKHLEGEPIEFWIVGGCQINIPPEFQNHPQIRWIGRIRRHETAYYYQQADVFLFPTLSDGFGLTQLEAQAWQLPVIASQNCGQVVVDGENGWILPEVTGSAIATCLKPLLNSISNLQEYSKKSYFFGASKPYLSLKDTLTDIILFQK